MTGLNQIGRQWSVWLAVLRSPLSVVSKGDLNTEDALHRAYRFFLFIYIVVFLLRVPFFDVFLGMDMTPLNILALFALNMVSFAVFILMLYSCAKILFGRGSLQSTAITAIYLAAFWPLLILISYLSGLSPQVRGLSSGRMLSQWWLEPVAGLATVALLMFLFFYLIVKSMPAIKYLHQVGNIRAILICGFGYVLAFEVQNWLTLKLLLKFVTLTR